MKKIFLSLLLFPCCSLIAQKINYQVLKDNPKMYFHGKAGVIYDGDFNKGNNRSGYIFQGIVNFGKRFSLSAEYQTTQQKWDNVNKTAVNIVPKSPSNLSARGTLFFQASEQKEDTRISLKKTSSSVGNYTYTNETFIYAPATTLRKIGVTGSMGYYVNNLLDNQRYDSLFQLKDQNGNPYNSMNVATNVSGTRFSGGFQFSIVKNFVIKAQNTETGENYGKKTVKNKVDVFLEALWMPTINIEENLMLKDEFMNNNVTNLVFENKPAIQNFGYRFVVESDLVNLIGLGFRIEFGSRPGIAFNISETGKLKNFYGAFGMHFNINK